MTRPVYQLLLMMSPYFGSSGRVLAPLNGRVHIANGMPQFGVLKVAGFGALFQEDGLESADQLCPRLFDVLSAETAPT